MIDVYAGHDAVWHAAPPPPSAYVSSLSIDLISSQQPAFLERCDDIMLPRELRREDTDATIGVVMSERNGLCLFVRFFFSYGSTGRSIGVVHSSGSPGMRDPVVRVKRWS